MRTLYREGGHDAVRVQEDLELGFDDGAIVQYWREEGRIILTNDGFFRFDDRSGVLLLARQTAAPRAVATAVRRIESLVGVDALDGRVMHVPGEWGEVARRHRRVVRESESLCEAPPRLIWMSIDSC